MLLFCLYIMRPRGPQSRGEKMRVERRSTKASGMRCLASFASKLWLSLSGIKDAESLWKKMGRIRKKHSEVSRFCEHGNRKLQEVQNIWKDPEAGRCCCLFSCVAGPLQHWITGRGCRERHCAHCWTHRGQRSPNGGAFEAVITSKGRDCSSQRG